MPASLKRQWDNEGKAKGRNKQTAKIDFSEFETTQKLAATREFIQEKCLDLVGRELCVI